MSVEDVEFHEVGSADALVGIVTGRDVRFERRMDALVRDVMTPKEQLVTASEDADFDEITGLLHEHRIEKVLLVGFTGVLSKLRLRNSFRMHLSCCLILQSCSAASSAPRIR